MTMSRARSTAWIALALALAVGMVLLVQAHAAGRAVGSRIWAARAKVGKADDGNAVAVSPDGSRVFVAGDHDDSLMETDWATFAYDSKTGRILWAVRRRGAGQLDTTKDIAVSPDGSRVFVTGTTYPAHDLQWATAAYDADTGQELWFVTYRASDFGNFARRMLVSPDSATVYVVGDVDAGAGDFTTIAYSASTGAELWTAIYDGPSQSDDFVRDAAISPDGSTVVVAGASSEGVEYYDQAAVAYDAETGTQRWAWQYAGSAHGFDEAYGVTVSPDSSNVYVTGYVDEMTGEHFGTFAIDVRTGEQLWAAESSGSDDAVDVAASPDGSLVFVTGTTGSWPSYDFLTVAYDAHTGLEAWQQRYDGSTHHGDTPVSIMVSPEGDVVYVTGFSEDPDNVHTDYATIALTARTGQRRWLRLYDGPGGRNGRDEPSDLAVNPDGSSVFVTGRSVGRGGDFDMATVAYRA